ncbi:MAG TPA: sigma-54 dependent transcriptional regulator [Pyrinomonadaceae bacterium]|jgi:DNA-binding NtrC family response regulator|nr:sigma-54 dependent transcriptional regulator [Pyrinomonadaceae bacterium]
MSEPTPQHIPDKATVLVVDDDQVLRRQLFWALDSEHHVLEADSRAAAIAQLQSGRVQVVLCDLHLPPDLDGISEGLAVIEAARAARPSIPVIVITGSNSRQTALEAIRCGAYGFFEKPFNEAEVTHIVRQAARVRHLEEENLKLRASLDACRGFGRLMGSSPALERILKQARAVASTSATVLLAGENGTGKEMLARAVHEESPRAAGPFIAVSCAALPEDLIESELFGHEKGAFTGASQAKMGRFELADGGTLFLDEIGELSQAVQVKLLRVLQDRTFERLGGTKTLTVDIRLIAASNRDLEQEVEEKRFRRDLFYRLNVVPLQLPPLRERREDLPVLAAHFATKAADKHGRPPVALDAALIEALQEYDWPGNVRELENLMERLVVLTTGSQLGTEFLPEKMLHIRRTAATASDNGRTGDDETTLEGAMLALKRRLVINAMQAESGNKAAAAKRLGISRSYFHRLISELDITA